MDDDERMKIKFEWTHIESGPAWCQSSQTAVTMHRGRSHAVIFVYSDKLLEQLHNTRRAVFLVVFWTTPVLLRGPSSCIISFWAHYQIFTH